MRENHLYTDTIDNPLWQSGNTDELRKSEAVHTFRDDPLGRLYARGQIDKAQFRAGRKMQSLYESAEGAGRIQGQDTTREPVDGGGRIREILTDRQNEAMKRIALVNTVLGKAGAEMVRYVLAERGFINQMANSKAEVTFLGRLFRSYLSALAVEFGYRTLDTRGSKSAYIHHS
jgi:hypothetical protein